MKSLAWWQIALAVWMVMFAIASLTNVTVVWFSVLHGLAALACAICLALQK